MKEDDWLYLNKELMKFFADIEKIKSKLRYIEGQVAFVEGGLKRLRDNLEALKCVGPKKP